MDPFDFDAFCNCDCAPSDPYCNCPPYNKYSSNYKGCLKQKKPLSVGYVNYCAEADPSSTYFEPSIRVRYQACNLACWAEEKTLGWDGECVVWPSSTGVPTYRFCARITLPTDDGYTNDSVNVDGVNVQDPTYGASGQDAIKLPKICAFYDPWMLDIGAFDPMDYNPLRQPFHYGSGMSPLMEALAAGVKNGVPLTQVITAFFNAVTGVDLTAVPIVSDLMTGIDELQKYASDALTFIIDNIGQLNNDVKGTVGCAVIPLGPNPPRYCPILGQCPPVATINKVCAVLPVGPDTETSLRGNPCVTTAVQNNLINNMIRVGFDEKLPLCKTGADPYKTDSCVKIDTLQSPLATRLVDVEKLNYGLISKCSTSTPPASELPCVHTSINKSKFRLVYGVKQGVNIRPLEGFASDVAECDINNTDNCLTMWGINFGNYADIALSFPQVETSYQNGPLTNTVTIQDSMSNSRSFVAQILRSTSQGIDGNLHSPNQICVYEDTTLIGCKDRPKATKPSVYECGASWNNAVCNSSFFSPQMVVRLTSGNSSTEGVIGVPNMAAVQTTTMLNLAGYDYTSFATDNTNIQMPFSTPPAQSAYTLYGKYLNNTAPFDAQGNRNTAAQYMSGLEYIAKQYVLGGTQLCLDNFQGQSCNQNIRNCVLTKLLNSNYLQCNTVFAPLISKYNGLTPCNSAQASCSTVETVDSLMGKINIKNCPHSMDPRGFNCYIKADGSIMPVLCNVSYDPNDRVDPPYTTSSSTVLADDLFYNTASSVSGGGNNQASSYNYDANLYAVRDKTPIEHGLCVSIPEPTKCNSIDNIAGNNLTDGYATWPVTALGQASTGTCINGVIPSTPITRTCVIDFTTGIPVVKFSAVVGGNCQECIIPVLSHSTLNNYITAPAPTITDSNGSKLYSQTISVDYTNTSITSKGFIFNLTLDSDAANLSKLQHVYLKNMYANSVFSIRINNTTVYSAFPSIGQNVNFSQIDIKEWLQPGLNTINIDQRFTHENVKFDLNYEQICN